MLLSKTLRSSTLKLAYIYVIAFSSAIFMVLGYVYWSTITYVSEKSDGDIMAERALLMQTYDNMGRSGLIALINRRVAYKFFYDWAYLLTDPSLIHVSGNLKSWPATLYGDQVWKSLLPLIGDRNRPSRRCSARVTSSCRTAFIPWSFGE